MAAKTQRTSTRDPAVQAESKLVYTMITNATVHNKAVIQL